MIVLFVKNILLLITINFIYFFFGWGSVCFHCFIRSELQNFLLYQQSLNSNELCSEWKKKIEVTTKERRTECWHITGATENKRDRKLSDVLFQMRRPYYRVIQRPNHGILHDNTWVRTKLST